jgi:hypothetical protein
MTKEKELNLFKSGILVDIDIHKWNAQVKLEPEDLGLKEEDLSELMKLGTKYLIPKEYIEPFFNLDAAARRALSNYSIKFPIGDTAFVPIANFNKLMQKLEEIKNDFNAYKKEFIAKYEILKKKALEEYESYSRILQKKNKWTEEQRLEFIEKIKSYYKTPEQLEQQIRFDITIFKINLDVAFENENINTFRKTVEEKINEFVGNISNYIIQQIKELYEKLLVRKKRITENLYEIIKEKLESLKNMNITQNEQVNKLIDDTLNEIKGWIGKDIEKIEKDIKESLNKTDNYKLEKPKLKILL